MRQTPTTSRHARISCVVVFALMLASLGAGFGSAQAAGSRTSPAANATGGFLKLWAPQFMSGVAPTSEAAAVAAAKSVDVLAVNTGDYGPYVDAMHAAHPGVKILFYEVATTLEQSFTGTLPEQCYLHDKNGNRVSTKLTGLSRWGMDPRCPEWIAERIDTAKKVLAKYHFDGIFMDVLGLAPIGTTYLSGQPIDPKTGKPFTPTDWINATVALSLKVKAATGVYILGNGLRDGNQVYQEPVVWKIADKLDAGQAECWFWCSAPGNPSAELWQNSVRMLSDPQHPKPIYVTSKGWTATPGAATDAEHLFSLASFLIGTNGNDYYSWTNTKATDATVISQWERNTRLLGQPSSTYTTVEAGLYQRRFTGGLVLASVTGSHTVNLPGPMTTISGQTVTSVSLGAGQAQILFKNLPLQNGAMTTGGFSNGTWTLASVNAAGSPLIRFNFGTVGDVPVVGDWDGNGTTTIGVVRGNAWYLRNANSTGGTNLQFTFGRAGDQFLIGDWNGDKKSTPGVRRDKVFYLNNSFHSGVADISVPYGLATDEAFVGDWNGDGITTPGVRRGNTFYLKNSFTGGDADIVVPFGLSTDQLHMGDWNGDKTWTPGLLRSGTTWYLQNSFQGGNADITFPNQTPGIAVVGNWDGK